MIANVRETRSAGEYGMEIEDMKMFTARNCTLEKQPCCNGCAISPTLRLFDGHNKIRDLTSDLETR